MSAKTPIAGVYRAATEFRHPEAEVDQHDAAEAGCFLFNNNTSAGAASEHIGVVVESFILCEARSGADPESGRGDSLTSIKIKSQDCELSVVALGGRRCVLKFNA